MLLPPAPPRRWPPPARTRRIALCRFAAGAQVVWDRGVLIAAGDFADVAALPFEVAVEATGDPEAGTRHAVLAIAAGHHVVMVTKETDSVVGPEHSRRSAARGLVVTPRR